MRMTLYTMRQSGSQAFGSSGLGFRGVGRSFRQAVLRFAIAKETCILFSFLPLLSLGWWALSAEPITPGIAVQYTREMSA